MYFGLKRAIVGCLAIGLGASAFAVTTSDDPIVDEVDEQRTLDKVITRTAPPDEDAPKTGRLIFRPLLYANSRQTFTSVNEVEFVFTAVEEDEEGFIRRFEDQQRQDYRAVMVVPSKDFASRFDLKADRYLNQFTDLPGGTYALSELKYRWLDNRTNTIRIDTFCLSEGTIAFDLQNGETGYLGAIGIRDLPSNTGRFRHHAPLRVIDQDPNTLVGEAGRIDDLQILDFSGALFADDSGMCEDARFQIKGWRTASR